MKRKSIIIVVTIFLLLLILSCEKEVSRSVPVLPQPIGGTLVISSIPDSAQIYLDGKTTGLFTPDSITWLEVKNYKVTLKKELYLDTTFQINIEQNITKKVKIDFNSNPNMWGSITCQSTPDNAKIVLNGKDTGKRTPTVLDSLIPNHYIVKYFAENHRSDSIFSTVTSGSNSLAILALTDTTYWVDYNRKTSGIFSDTYHKIAIDRNDVIWLGSISNGITKFDGNVWSKFTKENSGLVGNAITELEIGPDGHLWVCTLTGLSEFDGIAWKNYRADMQNGLPSDVINDIAFESDGTPLVATKNGIARYKNNKWAVYRFELNFPESFTAADKKDQNYYTGIDVDNEGNWWATRLRNGIAHWNGNNWRHYFTYFDDDVPERNIYYNIVTHTENEIWFGHAINEVNNALVGLSSFINGEFDKQSYNEFFGAEVNSIKIKDNNEKWISTDKGLFRFINYPNLTVYSKKTTPLVTSEIKDVAFDSKGNVWVVTFFNGIYRFKNNKP